MAEDRDKGTPSLEPPSLFGRKKKSPPRPEPPAPAETVETAPTGTTETAAETAPQTEAEPPTVAASAAAPVAPPAAEPVPPVAEPVIEPVIEPAVAAPVARPAEPTVAQPAVVPVTDDSPSTIFDDTSEPTPDVTAPVRSEEPRAPREPWLAGRPAAALTGLLVGALIVAATAGSLRVCTAVKGTSSCGGPGFFLLVAIMIVAVLVGAALLRGAQVPEPGSTSFLAVGLLSVVALLFLVGSIFEWWMVIVIPLVSVATFLLSHWVTTTYVDPANDGTDRDRQPEPHDVR